MGEIAILGQENRSYAPNRLSMNRKQRTILLLVVFWGVVIGVPGAWLWRMDQQERLNQQLIATVKREDTPSALLALERGADANTRDEPVVPAWQRIWDLLRGNHSRASMARPVLTIAVVDSMLGEDEAASVRGKTALIAALLKHGARIDTTDTHGWTALSYALLANNAPIARALIEHGASVTARPDNENLLIMAVACCRDADVIERMLLRGADPNAASALGETPLATAVFHREPLIVECLLRHHANPDQAARFEMSTLRSLEYADQHHLTEIARLLRAAGAKR